MRQMPSNSQVAAAIDATLTRPVLVVGSPPPTGRDLDLLPSRQTTTPSSLGWRKPASLAGGTPGSGSTAP